MKRISFRKKILIYLIVLTISFSSYITAADLAWVTDVEFELLNKEKASQFIKVEDDFVNEMAPLERALRLNKLGGVSKKEYLKYISKQTLNWNEEERKQLDNIFNSIKEKLDVYRMLFPEKINIIKTTGKEEGNAFYTRRNAIFIPEKELANMYTDQFERIMIHEMFHIFTRHNPEIRNSLYNIIGFEMRSKVKLPESVYDRKLTNPDSPVYKFYFETEDKEIFIPLMLLFNFKSEPEADIIKHMRLAFIKVREEQNQIVPAIKEGKGKLYSPSEVPGLFKKIGQNTDYILGPEEILAENFVLMVEGETIKGTNVKTPEVIIKLRNEIPAQCILKSINNKAN